MALRHYTAAQLLYLRDSPLVVKPDNLPAIEQWIEYVYLERPDGVREKLRIPHSESTTHNNNTSTSTANTNNKRDGENAQRGGRAQRPGLAAVMAGGIGGESSPMGSFSTGRPPMTTRSSIMRANGDDISLGPPRTMFPSSRNVPKLSDLPDKPTLPADGTPSDELEANARSKFFSDRQLNRRSLTDKEGGKDSWTTVRERREGQKDRDDRFVRHDKDDSERRSGFGDRHDTRWSSNREDRRNGESGRGGWREREQQRRERDGDRGHNERDPEWMDDPVVKKDLELGFTAKTQEDFQKWKDSMSKKIKTEPEKDEQAPGPTPLEPAPPVPEAKPAVVPLKLDGFENGFGSWAPGSAGAPQSATTPGAAVPSASKAPVKPKTSRFASMFVKPAPEEPALIEETAIQKAANGMAKTSAEDQEGFNRVLQMLGSTKMSQAAPPTPIPTQEQTPASPPPAIKTGVNGTIGKPRSRFTDMFAQKDPERLTSPQQGGVSLGGDALFSGESRGGSEEPLHLINKRQPERQASEQHLGPVQRTEPAISPAPSAIPFNALREQQPRPQSGRMNDIMFDPPSRGPPTPDINIQNLLAQQRQRPHHTSNESQQLLNLLRKDTSNPRPPSQHTLAGNGALDQAQVQHWLEQQQRSSIMAEPHAPKPRVPQQAPGLFEEQLMRNYPIEQQRPDMSGMGDMPQRRTAQHAPPGLPNEQQLFMHQQQQHQHQQQHQQQQQQQQQQHQQLMGRRYNDMPSQQQQQMPAAGRRMSGHPNAPQMQIPHQGQQYVSDYHQITSPGGQGPPPPPGFGPRHSGPGFGSNFYQPPPQQRDGPPPGLGNNNMQSLPPGHFGGLQGIPGYMMRSPTDGMPPPGLRREPPRAYDPYEMRQR